MMRTLIQSLLCASLLLTAMPAFADVKNIDYQFREVEISGQGPSAEQAIQNCEELALASALKELIQTDQEQEKLKPVLLKMLAQRDKYLKRLKILGKGTTAEGGRYYKILYQVNLAQMRQELEASGVILSAQELREELHTPVIAAYYKDPRENGPYAQWALERVNHFLLAHDFHVVDAQVWRALSQDDALLTESHADLQQLSRLMALKARADVYLEIEIAPEVVGKSGEFTYIQSPVSVKAYESSSGEPFITKIYQRLNRKGEPEALAIKGNLDVTAKAVLEESIAGAMPLVLNDLTQFWKQNLAQGQQYALHFDLPPDKLARLLPELKLLVKQLESKDDVLMVRYPGMLGDLADAIEESLGGKCHLKLKTFNLGKAWFEEK